LRLSEVTHNSKQAPFESLTDVEKQHLLVLLEKLAQDWHDRFRGEGHSEHKHRGEGARNFKQRREDKHGHDSEHHHGRKQARRHHHDSF